MFERFRKDRGAGTTGAVSADERDREMEAAALREREREAVDRRDRAAAAATAPSGRFTREPVGAPVRERDTTIERPVDAPVVGAERLRELRARQRDRFGGFSWGSDFFGWLSALGLASILTALLVAAGASIGLSEVSNAARSDTVKPVGLAGGILLLAVLAIAWFCGGYVAGRMARFDGARQGLGVWLWTILAVVAVAVLAAIGGRQYDLLEQLNLPRVPVNGQSLTTGGAIALGAAVVTTLVFAVLGGLAGERFHRRVDRVAVTG
jgi:hypothetical protein